MAKVIVIHFSEGGNTRKMAESVAEGVRGTGVECDLMPVADVNVDALTGYDGIILGSPTYYGYPAAELKTLVDASVKHHGQLTGKVGGAFASCGVLGGGAETTVRALIDAMFIHGMVVQGASEGGHYGPISVGAPNKTALDECRKLGERVASLVTKLV